MEEAPRKPSAAELAAKAVGGGKIDLRACGMDDLVKIHAAVVTAVEQAGRSLAAWSKTLRQLELWRRELIAVQLENERRAAAEDVNADPVIDSTGWH